MSSTDFNMISAFVDTKLYFWETYVKHEQVYFKLVMTAQFAYLGVYLSSKSIHYFKTLRTMQLDVKTIWDKCLEKLYPSIFLFLLLKLSNCDWMEMLFHTY